MDPHLCSRIALSHHPATWFCRINFLRSSRDHSRCTRSSCVSHLKPPFLDPTPPSMRCLTSRTLINSCGHLVSLLLSHLSTSMWMLSGHHGLTVPNQNLAGTPLLPTASPSIAPGSGSGTLPLPGGSHHKARGHPPTQDLSPSVPLTFIPPADLAAPWARSLHFHAHHPDRSRHLVTEGPSPSCSVYSRPHAFPDSPYSHYTTSQTFCSLNILVIQYSAQMSPLSRSLP